MLTWLNASREEKPAVGVSLEAAQRLHAYMDSWKQCAPNAILWRDRFPDQWLAICRALSKTQLILYPAVDGCIAAWDVRPGVASSKSFGLWQADKLFADFLVYFPDKIAACKREECGRYFERSPQKTDYCSDRCGKTATSKVAKRAARHKKRHRRMLMVLTALRELSRSKFKEFLVGDETQERPAWTDYVVREVSGVTDRWLSEAILGRLETPEAFAICERCAEIRGQIHSVLEGKGGKAE